MSYSLQTTGEPAQQRHRAGCHCAHPLAQGRNSKFRRASLEVVLPFDLVKRSKVHEDLTVDSKVKQLADIGLNERRCLFFGEVKWLERVMIFFVSGL